MCFASALILTVGGATLPRRRSHRPTAPQAASLVLRGPPVRDGEALIRVMGHSKGEAQHLYLLSTVLDLYPLSSFLRKWY